MKLQARDVVVHYRRQRYGDLLLAVDGVTLDIDAGEFVAIVGPSGCGKTTFLNAVDGLIPITSGTIAIDGRAIDSPGRDRAVGVQQPSLLPWRPAQAGPLNLSRPRRGGLPRRPGHRLQRAAGAREARPACRPAEAARPARQARCALPRDRELHLGEHPRGGERHARAGGGDRLMAERAQEAAVRTQARAPEPVPTPSWLARNEPLVIGSAAVVVFLVAWVAGAGARIVSPLFLPGPADVISAYPELIPPGEIC